jgi:hypothetical protein
MLVEMVNDEFIQAKGAERRSSDCSDLFRSIDVFKQRFVHSCEVPSALLEERLNTTLSLEHFCLG